MFLQYHILVVCKIFIHFEKHVFSCVIPSAVEICLKRGLYCLLPLRRVCWWSMYQQVHFHKLWIGWLHGHLLEVCYTVLPPLYGCSIFLLTKFSKILVTGELPPSKLAEIYFYYCFLLIRVIYYRVLTTCFLHKFKK